MGQGQEKPAEAVVASFAKVRKNDRIKLNFIQLKYNLYLFYNYLMIMIIKRT
jgi:hypothetical protein